MIGLLLLGLISMAYGEAPYIPRGWTPEGQAFNLPPKQQYGSPNTQYLPSQESARDFNRIETEYGSPNTYSNDHTLRANIQPINQAGYWQQNTNTNQFLQPNINTAAQNNQFTPSNQPQANLNKNDRVQWNINQNTAQSNQFVSTNTFNKPEQSDAQSRQISQTQPSNHFGTRTRQQWSSNNKMNVPQSNYDESVVNITPQPSFNQNNHAQPTNTQNTLNNANKYDVNFDTQSNNHFGQFVPRDKITPSPKASNNNRKNVNQNNPPPQQYDGDAPEDVFALKTDKTTIKPENNVPEMNTDENDENESAQLNVAVKAGAGSGTSMMLGSMTGQYYLLLPDGRLQRVIYLTSPNDNESGYTANLMYENVEPLKGPIFSYNDSPLVRVN